MFLLTTGGLLLEDQHRAQPWMIHYLWDLSSDFDRSASQNTDVGPDPDG